MRALLLGRTLELGRSSASSATQRSSARRRPPPRAATPRRRAAAREVVGRREGLAVVVVRRLLRHRWSPTDSGRRPGETRAAPAELALDERLLQPLSVAAPCRALPLRAAPLIDPLDDEELFARAARGPSAAPRERAPPMVVVRASRASSRLLSSRSPDLRAPLRPSSSASDVGRERPVVEEADERDGRRARRPASAAYGAAGLPLLRGLATWPRRQFAPPALRP